MDMAKHADNRHSRRENTIGVVQRFLCCSCFQTGENDRLEYNQEKPQNPKAVVDEENVHIVVEDLGIDNPGFSLSEVEHCGPPHQITMGRSASSVSMCQRAALKKKLAPLSSLPLQSRAIQNSEDDSTVDSLLYSSGSTNVGDGGLLTPPVINLIPPTPSDVIDDDQFFDINSEEESLQQTSGSEGVDSIGSAAMGEQESEEDVDQDLESEGNHKTKDEEHPQVEPPEEETAKKKSIDKSTIHFLRSTFHVPPLPEYPRKRSFNTGISLLQFTEHNLDDLSNKDACSHELLKEELRLLPLSSKISMLTHQKLNQYQALLVNRIPKMVHQLDLLFFLFPASYIPQSKDHTGKSVVKWDSNGYRAKTLAELNTEEVCQWFNNIGLQKCLPFIREAEFSGSHIASIDLNTLEILQVSSLEERERLLSAIYHELHPPNSTTQRLDSLLERFGPHNVEKFTAALVSMTKSKSSPQVGSINMNRCSFKFRPKEQNARFHKNSHLIEITVNASDRTVHLRTPKETSVGKVVESCLRMLGINEEKDHFNLKSSEDEFSLEQQIGDLPGSETRLMELHLYRKETQKAGPYSSDNNIICTTDNIQRKNLLNNTGKIQELNQQMASLQNVIIQVQELYHGLVAFCSELKKMEGEMVAVQTDSFEVKRLLSETQDNLQRKRQSLQTLRDNLNTAPVQKNKPSEVRLLEKMRLNCQVFKDEITLVHLNRQVAHLREVLEKMQAKEKAERKSPTLTQLVSLQSPVMLVATQVKADPDGHYGFSAHWVEGQGLMVVHTGGANLCLNDRLVEVNGLNVLGSSEDELESMLKTHTDHTER
ncbi:uncharacterized protein LOC107654911 [Sinocyclocheilus anshuiensis]|uniref:uncharacterized protein LOC107654911 n=1 Tax=Sinocyclocheilus anshuiensis TaxID=1608454 RepID=UPI0007BA7D3F|nr:PREDICTED: uncharacterized protein LOC107654911 [Sinocyclocheilus anshuiensis]